MIALAMPAAAPASADHCGDRTPGRPVPECRLAGNGNEADCGDAGAVRLWPLGLRPGLPGETLPSNRDSTQYNSTSIPGAISGHELFHSLDIVGNFLYVTYNAGVQIWKIGGANAEDPDFLTAKDGWRGDFFQFEEVGENDFYVDDVAAINTGGSRLVAVSGRDTIGVSLWEHTVSPFGFEQLYQDITNRSQEVRVAHYAGKDWAFAAGTLGIFVYDMTAAQNAPFPCIDQGGAICPGIYKGKLGSTFIALHLDLIERGGRIYVAKSGGNGVPVQIWETSNPASPGSAVLRFQGLTQGARGVSFFDVGGDAYLGVIARNGTSWQVRIYDVDHCLDTNGCGTNLGSPVYTRDVEAAASSAQFLTYSTSDATPFLYYGLNEINLDGTKVELLLDLTGLPDLVTEFTESGAEYTDGNGCTGEQVDYWGDYYPKNGRGMANHRPMVGKFKGDYFYRAAYGMLDVHVKTIDGAAVAISGGPPGGVGFVDVDYDFEATALGCVPDPVWTWNATGGGQIVGTEDTVQISWSTVGSKTVTASNSSCAAPAAVLEVEIQNPEAVVGGVAVDPAAPTVCETVTFTAEDVGGQPPFTADWEVRDAAGSPVDSESETGLSFEWTTGDTTPAGTYSAWVSVANAANQAGDTAETFFELGAATLEFTQPVTYDGAPGAGAINVPVQFRAVTAGASSWTWDFGDGSPEVVFNSRAAGENPQHTYTAAGNYDAALTIDNCVGAMDTDQVSIEIVEEPLGVSFFRAVCPFGSCEFCVGEEVFFSQEYQGVPDSYSYDWTGDGIFGAPTATQQESHVYFDVDSGFFPQVKVTSGSQEIIATSTNAITVYDDPSCEFEDPRIFLDGFESGDTSAWPTSKP